jgi:hypothetical protein
MQNSATGRKRNALGLTVFVLVQERFAKVCKPAQKLILQLQIRCFIRLSYGRRKLRRTGPRNPP